MDSKEEIRQKAKEFVEKFPNDATDIILFSILEVLIDIRDQYTYDLQQKYVGGRFDKS